MERRAGLRASCWVSVSAWQMRQKRKNKNSRLWKAQPWNSLVVHLGNVLITLSWNMAPHLSRLLFSLWIKLQWLHVPWSVPQGLVLLGPRPGMSPCKDLRTRQTRAPHMWGHTAMIVLVLTASTSPKQRRSEEKQRCRLFEFPLNTAVQVYWTDFWTLADSVVWSDIWDNRVVLWQSCGV